ncbi:hypothetical protein V3M81_03040 [Trueperella pyogenes]|uniref:hypothetical protein n=1 Tax=Trueperella pyogenes TaxID=1661 RepID=UPI000F87058E|nr:hypothetical protein [Trueperella pyogenes]
MARIPSHHFYVPLVRVELACRRRERWTSASQADQGQTELVGNAVGQLIKQTRRARASWRVPYQLYLAG